MLHLVACLWGFIVSRHSMGLSYLPGYLHWGGLGGQCRHIWHTWSVWGIKICISCLGSYALSAYTRMWKSPKAASDGIPPGLRSHGFKSIQKKRKLKRCRAFDERGFCVYMINSTRSFDVCSRQLPVLGRCHCPRLKEPVFKVRFLLRTGPATSTC